jgi:hypothetical protein
MKEGITFIKDKDKRPPSTKYINYDEFIKFTGDRWTEELHKFENELKRAELAKTPEQQLLAIDRILDMVHGRGGVADWFVEGGDSFLNHLRDSKASNKSHRESLKKISDQIRILAGLVAGVKKVKIPYTKK